MKSVFLDENGDLWVVPDKRFEGERSMWCPSLRMRCGRHCPLFDEDTDDTGQDIAACGLSNRPIGFLEPGKEVTESRNTEIARLRLIVAQLVEALDTVGHLQFTSDEARDIYLDERDRKAQVGRYKP